MDTYIKWLNSLFTKNKNDFTEWPGIKWVSTYNAAEYQQQRDSLLRKIDNSFLFKNTKPFHHQISKGCSICGKGKWNCLFITNKCNANCFYCPAPQQNDELPSAQGINFADPEDYAHFIRYFKFEGVSFSGGEPLLFFERTLEYLKKVRAIAYCDIYTWLYTNGILVDRDKIKYLASEGLDEIRFDIGATRLSLEKIKFAKGLIPNITIEIPAIPEEKHLLIKLLPEMVKAGVTNLNLHQLRLTKHNAKNIVKKGYTIISAEKPIVLESELTALEILNYAKENNIEIGINYCSFFFKNRFQKAGYRKQIAGQLASPDSKISENGYVRDFVNDSVFYNALKLTDINPVQNNHRKIKIGNKEYYYRYERVFAETNLSEDCTEKINNLINSEPDEIPTDPLLFKIWQLEFIEKGLRDY